MFRHITQLLSAMLLLFGLNSIAFAQSATATLSGFIADENGGFIPKADIEMLNTATALQRKTKTNGEGYFNVPLLPPGSYSLTASFDGFQRIHHTNIILNINDTTSILIRMKPGSINDTITITGEPPLLKNTPTVSTVVGRRAIVGRTSESHGHLCRRSRAQAARLIQSSIFLVIEDDEQYSVARIAT